MDKFPGSQTDFVDGSQAHQMVALNGLLHLVMILRKRHLITDGELGRLHAQMSAPLGIDDLADNRWVQDTQQNLDRFFAEILRVMPEEPS